MRLPWRKGPRTAGQRAYASLHPDEKAIVDERVGRVYTRRPQHYLLPGDLVMTLAKAVMQAGDAHEALAKHLATTGVATDDQAIPPALALVAERHNAVTQLLQALIDEGPVGHDYLDALGYLH